MKKLIVICAVAGLVLAVSNMAQATFTGWMNPTADSPGPNNWGFNNPTGAYTDGTGPDGWSYAWAMPGTMYGKPFNVHEFYGYGFSVPLGDTINGIEVRMDAWRITATTTGSLAVELSWDSGTSWTTMGYGTGTLPYGEKTYYEGSTSDTWGHTWTTSELGNNYFRVRLTTSCSGSITCSSRTFYLDWVPVKVYYGP